MDELKRQTRMLDEDVKQLTEEVHRLNSRVDKTDRDKRWLFVGLLLVVVLVGMIGFVAFRAENTAREQEQLRSNVLCPLYAIFLGAYDPNGRAAGQDRGKYEDAYGKIRGGWEAMRCTDPIVPPRSDSTPAR